MKHIQLGLFLVLLVIGYEGISQSATANKDPGIKYWSEEEIKHVAKQTDSMTVVLFWGYWCRPCTQAMEYIETLVKEKKLRAIYISSWTMNKGNVEDTEKISNKLNVSMDRVYHYDEIGTKELNYEGVSFNGVPFTFIYKDGKLIGSIRGDDSNSHFSLKKYAAKLGTYL